jgi:hypothetical protein
MAIAGFETDNGPVKPHNQQIQAAAQGLIVLYLSRTIQYHPSSHGPTL